MNIHHLELFYYVALHGGISAAMRHMPYGIQQPAISDQVIQLEESLAVTLFQRRPFGLTPAGKDLYEFIKPFFDNLTPMAEKLRGGASQHLRIAASEIVLRDHLPAVLQELRKQFPKLKVTLREGYDPEVVPWLERQEIDVAIGFLGAKPPTGIHVLPLTRLPLILLVPASSKLKSPDELWQRDRIEESLITVPSNEPMCRAFQEGLAKLKVDWFSGIEVSTLEMVQTYVANGYGIGVAVGIPKAKYHPQVRCLRLERFPMPVFGVLWQGRPTPVVNGLLDIVRRVTVELLRGEDPALLLPGSEPALAGQGRGSSPPRRTAEA
jgi:DNA-binding transcriptional LysR family regulator